MITHLKHILSVFIVLSLSGLGQNIPVVSYRVKNTIETEWVIKACTSEKVSKCCSYIQYIYDSAKCLIVKAWSNEYSCYYHQKVKVQIISQRRIQYIVTPKSLLDIKLNFAERSIDNYLIS